MKEPVCYELIKRTTKKMMMKEDFSYLWVDQVYHFWGEARKIDQNLEGRDWQNWSEVLWNQSN